jgi:hypothetical protein
MQGDIRAVQAFIDTMVGIPRFSYPAKRNAPRPRGPFCSVQLLEEYQESIPAQHLRSQTTTNSVYWTKSLAKLRLRILMVDTQGVQSIQVMHGWTKDVIKEMMISSGYGFIKIEPISLEDALLEKEWEDRQGFSLELYVTRTLEEEVDNLTGLTISGKYYEVGIGTYDVNIDIPEPI